MTRRHVSRWILFALISLLLIATAVSAQRETPVQPFSLSADPIWESVESGTVTDLAWGDIDNDGDLDLAVARISGLWTGDPEYDQIGRANYIYLNNGDQLAPSTSWVSEPDNTWSAAWGDMDQDGDLDLVVGNEGRNKIYENQNGRLSAQPIWQSGDEDATRKLAIADVNGDGWYDLVAGNMDTADKVYLNQRADTDQLFPSMGTPIAESDGVTISMQATDIDEDGVLDLFASQQNGYRIYVGDGQGEFSKQIACETSSSAGSGTLWPSTRPSAHWNLAVGLGQSAGRRMQYGIYANSAVRPLEECPENFWIWDGLEVGPLNVATVVVADVNGDKLLDLSTAWTVYLQTHEGDTSTFDHPYPLPHSLAGDPTSLTWADVDGDGDLDMTVAIQRQPVRIFRNDSFLYSPAREIFGDHPLLADVGMDFLSWADVDNDGDYDLLSAVTSSIAPVELRINENGVLAAPQPFPDSTIPAGVLDGLAWSERPRQYRSYAWGDLNGDGLIDLAISIRADRTLIFQNTGQKDALPFTLVWSGGRGGHAAAWGDVDQDGDLDLAVGRINEDLIYLNNSGVLADEETWTAAERMQSDRLTWFDLDGDGDVDLVATSEDNASQRIYRNDNGIVTREALNLSTSLFDDGVNVDLNSDGLMDRSTWAGIEIRTHFPAELAFRDGSIPGIRLIAPGKLAPAFPSAQASYIHGGTLAIEFELTGTSQRAANVYGYYSLDRGATWYSSTPAADSPTKDLATGLHQYTWDFYADGLVGPNDDVRFRLQVRPSHMPGINGAPGRNETPYVQTETFPFRVYGKQVWVQWEDGPPVEDAVVYQRRAGQFGASQLIRDNFGIPAQTASTGFLTGRAPLLSGDQLIALSAVPTETISIPFTDQYTLFYTSGAPIESGVETQEVDSGGVQTLTVSTDNRLLIFHLNVSLEWDARSDAIFLQQLEASFQRASAILYDVTNGQAALGEINLFHDKAYWTVADIIIHADNSLRPSAAIGGLVTAPVDDPDIPSEDGQAAYIPGQIRMGTAWDPYGENTADLGQQWERALAHELAHYLLFLPDNYLGLKPLDEEDCGEDCVERPEILRTVVCPGSFMTTTSDPSYSEFLTGEAWTEGDCPNTLAQKTTGRDDWQTLTRFYPMLTPPDAAIPGPVNLSLDVTHVTSWAYADAALPFPARNFDVRAPDQSRLRLPNAQAYLFQIHDPDDPTDDTILALGSPTGGDWLKVRGALPGDRLCLLDSGENYAGCIEEISGETVAVVARPLAPNLPAWQPNILAAAPGAFTVTLTVEQDLLPDETLKAQIFPRHYGSVPGNAPVVSLDRDGSSHTGTLTMGWPAYEVAVRIWVDATEGCEEESDDTTCIREAVTTLRLNPESWEVPESIMGGPNSPIMGGPNSPIMGGPNSPIMGGPNSPIMGGPNSPIMGGPNSPIMGGPNSPIMGGPNSPIMGGPNSPIMGGPNSPIMGGTDTSALAPILSADAKVVIYGADGFFADTFVESVQELASIPAQDAHPWLVPVGPAYRVTALPSPSRRYISITYLQRDVPEGYEYALDLYFLADGEASWQPVAESSGFVENLAVGRLDDRSGVYAVMASVALPTLQPGWNLMAYPLPVSRPVEQALRAIDGRYGEVRLASATAESVAESVEVTVQAYVRSLRVRRGPGLGYAHISYLLGGESRAVLEQDPVSGWLRISCPRGAVSATGCWISGSEGYVRLTRGLPSAVVPAGDEQNVTHFQPNGIYWIKITSEEPVILHMAPPVRGPDGELR